MKKYLNYFIVILASTLSLQAFANGNRYTIFVDAGSTGSKLHIFQYDELLSTLVINDVFSENSKPGLSSYADHPEAAGVSLKKLLDDATQFLQKNGGNVRAIQVNILATAGMRLLPEDKQQAIYNNVSDFVKNNYEFSIGDIKTISGKIEALYGWLDINYLLGNFQNHRITVGSIDMGGASTQIAFATEDRSQPEDEVSVDINNQHYIVFSKSFLGLGQDQARDIMTADQVASTCYPNYYMFNKKDMGNFNMMSCSSIYTGIIQKQKVMQQMISTQRQPFIAFSGIYFTYNFFNIDKTPDQFSLESHIQSVCNKTWEQLQKDYPNTPEKYLSTYCANGVYHNQLIYNIYRIEGSQLTVTNQIQNKDIDWTLGAALYSLTQ